MDLKLKKMLFFCILLIVIIIIMMYSSQIARILIFTQFFLFILVMGAIG